ncbi:MAG: hypothetical protein HYX74_06900 [Acidobacteria bacterium]|nr:hypothetical protein [Acidobacteriota bacterium]
MKSKIVRKTVRRSVALPHSLVDEVSALASPELRNNFNRLVRLALQEFVDRRKKRAFAEQMAQMAADPAIQAECARISHEFAAAEADGLGND